MERMPCPSCHSSPFLLTGVQCSHSVIGEQCSLVSTPMQGSVWMHRLPGLISIESPVCYNAGLRQSA